MIDQRGAMIFILQICENYEVNKLSQDYNKLLEIDEMISFLDSLISRATDVILVNRRKLSQPTQNCSVSNVTDG